MELYRRIWEKVDVPTSDEFIFSNELWKKYYTTSKILDNAFRSVVEFCADEATNNNESVQAAKRALNLRQLCIVYKKKIKWTNPNERRYLNILHPVANCPQQSLLDDVQHEIYCYLYQKLTRNVGRSTLSKEENMLFTTLHQKVLQERPTFYKYVESMWPAHQKRCHTIDPEVKKYVDKVWKVRLSSVKTYPQKYCNVKMVPLVFAGNSKLVRALPTPQDAASTGIAARYIPPSYGEQLKVSTDCEEIAAVFPPENFATKIPVSRDETAQNIAASCAPQVVISMSGLKCIMDNFNPEYDKEWDIPVVIREEKPYKASTCSKKVIYIDKPLPPRSMSVVDKNKWYHRYSIKALLCRPRSQGVLKPTARVSLDSKNASPAKSTQNTLTEQTAATENNVKGESPVSVTKKDDAKNENTSTEQAAATENNVKGESPVSVTKKDDAKNENTSTEQAAATENKVKGESPVPVTKENDAEIESDETSAESSEEESLYPSDSSTEKLVIACSDDDATTEHHIQKKRKMIRQSVSNLNQTPTKRRKSKSSDRSPQKQIKTYGKLSKQNTSDVSAAASSAEHDPMKSSPSKNGIIPEEENHTSEDHSKRTTLSSNVCISYKLWKLMLEKDSHEETRANFLKSESNYRNIVVLVRSKKDAIRITNGEVHPVSLTPKLEYQSEYGMELPSMSEICRQWVSLYFRDKCTLVRARVDAPSNKLLLVEEKKIEDLALEWFDQRIRSTLLSILYSVLLGLLDVEPGDYLLSHRKKMGAFASLMRATDRDSSFDLKELYENVDTEAPEPVTEIQWPPLDVNLQTPNQYKLHRVPGLFQPCDVDEYTAYKTQTKLANSKKRQRKYKKKKNKNKNNKNSQENDTEHSEEQTSPVKFGT